MQHSQQLEKEHTPADNAARKLPQARALTLPSAKPQSARFADKLSMSCVSKLPYPPDDALRAPAAVRRIAIRTTCQQANTSRRQQTAVPARSRCYPPYRNSHALPTNSTHRAVSKTARRRTQQATLSTRPPNRNPRVLPTTPNTSRRQQTAAAARSRYRPPLS